MALVCRKDGQDCGPGADIMAKLGSKEIPARVLLGEMREVFEALHLDAEVHTCPVVVRILQLQTWAHLLARLRVCVLWKLSKRLNPGGYVDDATKFLAVPLCTLNRGHSAGLRKRAETSGAALAFLCSDCSARREIEGVTRATAATSMDVEREDNTPPIRRRTQSAALRERPPRGRAGAPSCVAICVNVRRHRRRDASAKLWRSRVALWGRGLLMHNRKPDCVRDQTWDAAQLLQARASRMETTATNSGNITRNASSWRLQRDARRPSARWSCRMDASCRRPSGIGLRR